VKNSERLSNGQSDNPATDHLSGVVDSLFLARSRLSYSVNKGSIGLVSAGGGNLKDVLRKLWRDDEGQDIAEYAVMLAVILVLVVGTVRLVGSNANNAFSEVGSSIQ
jgi:Flp pilus assembly pilin Flp